MTKVDISDTLKRPLRGLRISVTDRCNFRCTYCMPFDEYQWVERTEVLSFAEIERLARLFVAKGFPDSAHWRRTSRSAKSPIPGPTATGHRVFGSLSLTTNGALLGEQAHP